MGERMTLVSRKAIETADRIVIFALCDGAWAIRCHRGKSQSLVSGGSGWAMAYGSLGAAERAVRRLNVDVSISIDSVEDLKG